jgi:hypothetical protein
LKKTKQRNGNSNQIEASSIEKKKKRFIINARDKELSIAAISECIRLRILDPLKWEFLGVGGVDAQPICNLNRGRGGDNENVCIRMIKNVPEQEYKQILATSDIGLSLTMTPNPSVSVFDFAAAGMIVVTNSFETSRTQAHFDEISSGNFIVVKSNLIGIVSGVSQAVQMIVDDDSKNNSNKTKRNIKLNLPTSWNDDEKCYGRALFDKVKIWLKDYSIQPFERDEVLTEIL